MQTTAESIHDAPCVSEKWYVWVSCSTNGKLLTKGSFQLSHENNLLFFAKVSKVVHSEKHEQI